MTKQHFIHYLKYPNALDNWSASELEKVLDEYPYFQTARLLYLKNLQQIKSSNFDEELKLTATFATNRRLIYELLNNTQTESISSTDFDRKLDELKKNIPSYQKRKQTTGWGEKKKPDVQTRQKELQRIITGRLFELEKNNIIKENKFAVQNIKSKIMTSVNNLNEKELSSFILRKVNELKVGRKIREEDRIKQQAEEEEKQRIEAEERAKIEKDKKQHEKELIDRFLKLSPNALKIDIKKDAEPKDFSESAASEDDNIVNETLALLYRDQGHYEKAIEAFEKLSLRIPKKRIYFAEQILEIKKLLNKSKS